MAKCMKITAAAATALAILFTINYFFLKSGFFLSSTITAWTISYHLLMRLAVGWIVDQIMHNQANYNHSWFQLKKFETKLYRILKIRKWKGKMPTYSPELFDSSRYSYTQIAQAMCQAEIVHECIIVLSFMPVLLTFLFGDFFVFLTTSLVAALYDSLFVMMQRYNRPRILKLAECKANNHPHKSNESRA